MSPAVVKSGFTLLNAPTVMSLSILSPISGSTVCPFLKKFSVTSSKLFSSGADPQGTSRVLNIEFDSKAPAEAMDSWLHVFKPSMFAVSAKLKFPGRFICSENWKSPGVIALPIPARAKRLIAKATIISIAFINKPPGGESSAPCLVLPLIRNYLYIN